MNKKGFTLIELIIVSAMSAIVLAIMVAILLPSIRTAFTNRKANDASLLACSIRDYMREELTFATDINVAGTNMTKFFNIIGGKVVTERGTLFTDVFYDNLKVSYTVRKAGNYTLEVSIVVSSDSDPIYSEKFTVKSINMELYEKSITANSGTRINYK